MSEAEYVTRECPFCKEEVKAEAVRCKHCQATLVPTEAGHKGICPFCKESINPQAVRCRHCGANLARPEQYYYPERPPTRRVPRRQVTAPVAHTRRTVARRGSERPVPPRFLSRSAPEGCNDYEIDGAGIWTFIGVDEDGNCTYELTDPAIEPGF